MKINKYLEKIRKHEISITKTAEELEMPISKIIEILRDNNIDWVGYSSEDLKRDLKILN